ncbi:AbrB family looped-hinge helix DNA binding protein [Psychrobacillus insolitus]|uniref:AbrB family looped-hinge helix DNA binding protein n=1 Tax=Psychrobacillus insolitus TaxID=1461 RepID=A0A2W7P9C5_9BACI|nr:AbrB/MazE/SpoVT family DNA-binding domain-containing protein [Psychrobacillus insolitus]PZX02901.1 AbrB family looped-hinge helix DNA binding protein [Psychrobacillus insolitus]
MEELKKVKISKQRQMTIPKVYFDALGIQEEVSVEMTEEGLLIRPIVQIPDDFAEQLLESMIAQGLSGQELLDKFKEAKSNVGWTQFKATQKKDTI